MGVSQWDDVSRTFMIPIRRWPLTSRLKFTRFLTCFRIRPITIFFIWHWLNIIIFGICIYHHERMCRVHSWSRFDLDLWPQGQIRRFLSCLSHNFRLLWHWHTIFDTWVYQSIACVAFIHDPDRTLTFDLKVQFIGFMTWFCVRAIAFCLWHCHTMFGTWVYHHGTMCSRLSWPLYDFDLCIFTTNLSLARSSMLFDIGIPRYGIWVITMRQHSWPLYDLDMCPICGWWGVSLVSFTHSFYLFYSLKFIWGTTPRQLSCSKPIDGVIWWPRLKIIWQWAKTQYK